MRPPLSLMMQEEPDSNQANVRAQGRAKMGGLATPAGCQQEGRRLPGSQSDDAFVAVVPMLRMVAGATAVANRIPYTAEAAGAETLLFAVLAHAVDAIRLICPPVRVKSNRKPTKKPNLVMPTTMTPSMTIAKASAMPQTCLVVPTLISSAA